MTWPGVRARVTEARVRFTRVRIGGLPGIATSTLLNIEPPYLQEASLKQE